MVRGTCLVSAKRLSCQTMNATAKSHWFHPATETVVVTAVV